MNNIDKIQDPYAVIEIIKWLQVNKKFQFKDKEEIKEYIDEYVKDNAELLKGEDGKTITKVLTPKNGKDGRSIIDVTVRNNVMTIHFSDDTTKEIKLPRITKYVGSGSSGSSTAKDTTYNNSDGNLSATNVKDALDELSQAGAVELQNRIDRIDLIIMFESSKSTFYTQYIKDVDRNIERVDVWENDTKALKLFTKDITIVNKIITQTVVTNNQTDLKVTKLINYDAFGDVDDSYGNIA